MIRKNLLKSLSVIMATMLAVMTVACGAVKTEDQEIQETAQEQELEESLVSAAASSSGDSEAGKVETVYVTADANGAISDVIVSEWLKNANASEELSDTTELKNIVNVKGDETFTDNGDGTVTWNAGGSDIYYQGTTDKELPVSMKVTYTLDGKEISPADLAGKSGKVTIRFEYTNNCKQTVNVDGKDIEVYTPFAMVSGLMLDADKFTNVEISNGKVISDGGSYIVMGVATPGLKESLDLDQEKLDELEESGELDTKLTDYFEVTADTTDFQLGMTITMASSDVLSDFGLSDVADSEKLDEVKEDMDELNDGSTELVDGTKELKDGTAELRDGVSELSDGTQDLADGTSTLYDGTKNLYDGVVTYTDGVSQVDNGAKALADGAKAAKEGADKLKNGMDEADLVNGANTLAAGAASVSQGVDQLALGLSSMTSTLTGLAQQDAAYGAIAAWLASSDPTVQLSNPGVDPQVFAACLNSVIPGVTSCEAANAWRLQCLQSIGKLQTIAAQGITVTATNVSLDADGSNAVEAETGTVTNPNSGSSSSDEGGSADSGDDNGNSGSTGDNGNDGAGSDAGNTGSDEGGNGNTGDNSGNGNSGDSSSASNSGSTDNSGSTGASTGASDEDLDDEDLEGDDLDDEDLETTDLSLLGANLSSTGLEEMKVTANPISQQDLANYANYYKAAGAAGGAYKAIHSIAGGMTEKLAPLSTPGTEGKTLLQVLSEGAAAVATGNAKLAAGIQSIYDGATTLDNGLGDLSDGASQLYDGTQQLTSNNSALVSGAYDVSDGARQLNDGASQLNDGVTELNDGVVQLDDGVQELLDGVVKLDEEGIKKLYEAFNGDLTDFTDRVQAVQEAGSNYKTFAGADADIDSSVKFIIKTEAVEAKDM